MYVGNTHAQRLIQYPCLNMEAHCAITLIGFRIISFGLPILCYSVHTWTLLWCFEFYSSDVGHAVLALYRVRPVTSKFRIYSTAHFKHSVLVSAVYKTKLSFLICEFVGLTLYK